MSTVWGLLLGFCVLFRIDQSGARSTSSGTEETARAGASRERNERKLVSEDSIPGEFPFFAQWGDCGATLIWEDILLTSASCNTIESESVIVGAYVSNEEQGDSVKRNIVSRQTHPTFDPNSLLDNFMVLKLDKKVDTLPTVWINPTVEIPTDPELYVVGFGFTATLLQVNQIHSRTFYHTILDTSEILRSGNENEIQGTILQKARVTIVPHAICNDYDLYAGFIDDESMICANDDDNTCLGDNGGPLCVMMNNECLQIGIVSFGELCSMGIRPTVYSSISSGFGWIEKMVCTLSDNPPASCQVQVETRAPYPGLSESFVSKTSNTNSKREPDSLFEMGTAIPSNEPSLAPSDRPSILNSMIPSDGPSLVPSIKPSFVNYATPSGLSSISDNKNKSGEQENRDLQEIRYKMPMDIFTEASNTITTIESPDGTHLFFWPYGSPYKKLGPCEGDCNSDDDCAEGLYCFQRDSSISSIPGCVGHDTSRTDFCTYKRGTNPVFTTPGRTSSSTTGKITTRPILSVKKLGQCEGDCNSDEDCADGLFCFMRDGQMASVPGCEGFDESRTDYCTSILLTATNNDNQAPINNAPWLFVYPENPPNPWNFPLQACQGDCDRDSDCAEGLICYTRRAGSTTIPGCSGISTTRTDFCVSPDSIASLGLSDSTIVPTASRTSETTVFETPFQATAERISQNSTPTTSSPSLTPTSSPSSTKMILSPTPAPISRATQRPVATPTSTRMDENPSTTSLTAFPSLNPKNFNPSPAPTPRTTQRPVTIPTSIRTNENPILSLTAPPSSTSKILNPSPAPTSRPTQRPVTTPTSIRTNENPTLSLTSSPSLTPKNLIPSPAPTPRTTQRPVATPTPTPIRTDENRESPTIPLTSSPGSTPKNFTPPPSPTLNSTLIQPTQSPSTSASSVLITVAIFFDPWPEEVSWKIESEEGKLVTSVLAGHYKKPQDQTFEVVRVAPGEKYNFTIADSGNDGIAGIGTMYEIILTEKTDIVLLDGDGVFENGRTQTFYVPTEEEYPTRAPSPSTISPAPTFHTVNVYLTIFFDNWHQETSWQIRGADDANVLYAEAAYDTYRAGESQTNEIPLPPGRSYVFTIKDFFNDGIKDGEYLLMAADGTVLFEGNGEFGASRNHTFTLREDS